jgi:hypothetical protein
MAANEIPLFEAEGASTARAWQRREMLVALLHGNACSDCDRLGAQLRSLQPGLARDEVELIFVKTEGDANGVRLARSLGLPLGSARLIVANRFAKLYAHLDAHDERALFEAAESIDLAQRQCGECSAPLDWDDGPR